MTGSFQIIPLIINYIIHIASPRLKLTHLFDYHDVDFLYFTVLIKVRQKRIKTSNEIGQ
jgi:hypothetical protein